MSFTDIVFAFAGLFGLFFALAVGVLSLTWLERKTLARIQQRAGPSVVGPHGLLQPFADAMKLVTKEDIIPAFCVMAYDEFECQPMVGGDGNQRPNVWDEPADKTFTYKGHESARYLAGALLLSLIHI